MTSYYPEKRPNNELILIYSTIKQFIHTDIRGKECVVYLVDPKNNEPGILLKMIKSGVNYTIDEAKPFILKGFGTVGFKVGVDIGTKMEWATYLNRLNNRPDKLSRTAGYISRGKITSNIARVSGKVINKTGILLDFLGTALIYYDILSAGSPSLIDSDKIIEATTNQISKLCRKSPPYNL